MRVPVYTKAFMRWRRLADRVWLTAIALSFAFLLPIWLILSIQRLGYRVVFGSIALALVWRFTKSVSTRAD